MPVGGATDFGSEHYADTQGRASLNVWSAQCHGRRQRQHRTVPSKDTHPVPEEKLKFLTPPGIEPGSPSLERRDSTDHATAADSSFNKVFKNQYYNVGLLLRLFIILRL